MSYLCIRPGIGININGKKIIFKKYVESKKLEFSADSVGINIISLFDGKHSKEYILNYGRQFNKAFSNYDLEKFCYILTKNGLLYQKEKNDVLSPYVQYSRQIDFFNIFDNKGKYNELDSQKIIQKSKVVIIGAGGLGSNVIEQLARCGVGNLFIYDSDIVDVSNLSNQSIYNHTDIGKYKVDVLKKI